MFATQVPRPLHGNEPDVRTSAVGLGAEIGARVHLLTHTGC